MSTLFEASSEALEGPFLIEASRCVAASELLVSTACVNALSAPQHSTAGAGVVLEQCQLVALAESVPENCKEFGRYDNYSKKYRSQKTAGFKIIICTG